ncbi:Chromosome (plasmid) partitioning protein ParB [Clostridiaceae bacterium JG1575]|nr:Chromosome (plasmid) partitioning protein ParB [Clostridiaceae bacterium JG1575]
MSKKFGLGKGLNSLLPSESPVSPSQVEAPAADKISINRLKPNKEQPRKHFDDDRLMELAESIRLHGIIQPILVTKAENGTDYVIVAGERRWRAAKKAGLKEVPVVPMDLSDQGLMEVSLIENIQRQDLNPVEEATAFQKLIESFQLTQEEIAQRVGKSRSAVANTLRLLQLDARVLDYLAQGVISEGHGRALLGLSDGELQYKICQKIIDEGFSVREAESYIRNYDKMQELRSKERKKDVFLEDLEKRIGGFLGTKVTFRQKNKNRGKIEIEYYNQDDLNRILDILQGEE